MPPVSSATRFHLLRHAEHTLQARALVGRMPGVRLSPAGRAQVEALAACFAGQRIDVVISSPIARARDTAAPIAARLGLPVGLDPGLTEIDFGEWTGMAFDALGQRPDWRAWNASRSLATAPGGEMMTQAQHRAMASLLRLRAEWPDGNVLIVSHADVLKAVLAQVLGMPLDLMHRLELAPGHYAVVTLWADGARVDAVNVPAGA